MDQSRRLEELLWNDEIRAVIMRLARGTDRLDAELIQSCYHPDGFDDHNAFRGSPAEFAAWVLEVLPHFAMTMHFVGNIAISMQPDGRTAHTESYCVAHHLFRADDPNGERDQVLGLRYVDRFERRDERWLIAHRVCAFDWTYTVPIVERWPFGADYTVGTRDRSDITYTDIPIDRST